MRISKSILENKNLYQFSLSLIILLGFTLRFYNFPKRYGFDFDAARDSLAASTYAKSLVIPLTGASSSVAPFNFGPWYYYLLILFEKIVPIYGSWILIGITSVTCIYLFYKIGEKLENKKFGLLLSILVAFSPSQIILSTTLSNPSLIPIFSALSLFMFVSYLKNKKLISVFLLGLFIGLGINIHFQMFGFLIFPILIVLFYKDRIKILFLSMVGFILSFLPIILYDLNNSFHNLKGLVFYFTSSRENVYVANRWLFYVRDFWPTFWNETFGVNLALSLLIIFSFVFMVLFLLYKKKLGKQYFLLFFAFLFNFVLLRYFPSQKPIYYLYFLQSFIFLFSGFLIFKLIENRKILPLGILFLFFIFVSIIKKDLIIISTQSSNREVVKIKEDLILKYPGESFNIYYCDATLAKGMALAYLLDKKMLVSENGRKIYVEDPSCVYSSKSLNNNWQSIASKSADEFKDMQVHKSY